MPHTSFTTKDGLYVGVEYEEPTPTSDPYLVAFYPDWPDEGHGPATIHPDDAPLAWRVHGEVAMAYRLTGGN